MNKGQACPHSTKRHPNTLPWHYGAITFKPGDPLMERPHSAETRPPHEAKPHIHSDHSSGHGGQDELRFSEQLARPVEISQAEQRHGEERSSFFPHSKTDYFLNSVRWRELDYKAHRDESSSDNPCR